jgi:hypothetical protein
MPRGPKLSPEVTQLIVDVHWNKQKWTARELRDDVENTLRADNKNVYKAPRPIPKNWPSLSTVQKILAGPRVGIANDPQGAPWTVGSITDPAIPPDVLHIVLHVSESLKEYTGKGLTIREAKWLGRLAPLISYSAHGCEKIPVVYYANIATLYAGNELVRQVLPGAVGTEDLDRLLWELLTDRTKFTDIISQADGPVTLRTTKKRLRQAENAWHKLDNVKSFVNTSKQKGINWEIGRLMGGKRGRRDNPRRP